MDNDNIGNGIMEEDSDILWLNGITQQADNSRENQVIININCATRGPWM